MRLYIMYDSYKWYKLMTPDLIPVKMFFFINIGNKEKIKQVRKS